MTNAIKHKSVQIWMVSLQNHPIVATKAWEAQVKWIYCRWLPNAALVFIYTSILSFRLKFLLSRSEILKTCFSKHSICTSNFAYGIDRCPISICHVSILLCENLDLWLYATKNKRENKIENNHTTREKRFTWFSFEAYVHGRKRRRAFTMIEAQRLQWTV